MNGQAVAEWVKKAEDNYLSALALSRRRKSPIPDVICNQCQQCVEKYLKALLVLHKAYFPKIHDLIQLEDWIARVDSEVRSIHNSLVVLNPYGIDIRYPGFEATIAEAKEAVKAMKEIRKFVRTKLRLKLK